VQLGRLATGEPAAVIEADQRVKIGSRVAGPGTALWVEAQELGAASADSDAGQRLATEYKALVIAALQRRDAWQVIDTVNRVTDPSALADLAGYAPYLSDSQKRQLLETPDVAERLTVLVEWTRSHLAEAEVNDKIAGDVREGMPWGVRTADTTDVVAARGCWTPTTTGSTTSRTRSWSTWRSGPGAPPGTSRWSAAVVHRGRQDRHRAAVPATAPARPDRAD